MEGYSSEREQLEQVKKWWDTNGKAIAIGLALGLAGLFGYRYWDSAQDARAESASINFQHLLAIASAGPSAEARDAGQALIDGYGRSTYGRLAALVLAKLEVAAGDLEAAKHHLDWVIEQAGDGDLGQIARARRARIELDGGDAAAAAATLARLPASAAERFPELRGDVLAANGKPAEAAEMYAAAHAEIARLGLDPALLELKQDSLATPAPAGAR